MRALVEEEVSEEVIQWRSFGWLKVETMGVREGGGGGNVADEGGDILPLPIESCQMDFSLKIVG